MSEKTTQIPSILGRLTEMLGGTEGNPMAEIATMGLALSAAGVILSGAASSAANLGALVVDIKLPTLVDSISQGASQSIASR